MGNADAGMEDKARSKRNLDYLRFYILVVVFGLCVVFYYAGEIVDLAGWTALRWSVFYSVHDLHRLLYMGPVVYAAYFFGARALVIVLVLSTASFLPRALFYSPYPDPLLRSLLFVAVAAVVGWVVSHTRSQALRARRERDDLLARQEGRPHERRP